MAPGVRAGAITRPGGRGGTPRSSALAGFVLLEQANSRLLVRDTNWAQETPSTVRETRRAMTPNPADTAKQLVAS